MILELKDGSRVDVKGIFGGPRLMNGVMRDTLRIEVDPSSITFGSLKDLFRMNPNTDELYVYNNPSNLDGSDVTDKTKIGNGYNIFVSITDEERYVTPAPGELAPSRTEEVYIVTIAQMTYEEHEANPLPVEYTTNKEE